MQINNKKKKIIVIVVLVVLMLALLGWIGYIVYNRNANDDIPKTDELEYIKLSDVTSSEDEGRDLQSEIKALNATYSDAIGWLKVSGTSIDYPVFQSTDNDRYLRNDRDNNYYMWGENFLDYRCNIDNINEKNIHYIIYGHNSSEDSCFTNFETDDEYAEFLKTLKSKSLYDTKVEVSKEDTILTLSTCEYSITDGRFVVQAKLIK